LPRHLGNADGPQLTFEFGPPPDERPTVEMKRPAILGGGSTDVVISLRTRWRGDSAPRTIAIGRATDNDIVVPDVLASRHHARLILTSSGMGIQDAHSINGTFVNGKRVKDAALRENDVVTIGNVDVVLADGKPVRHSKPAETTGGLEVRDVSLTIEDGDVTLLDRVSFTVRPGTLTAVIGPSGSGSPRC
jgi:ABC transport system ATP-binding/permease protein